ncbi:threonylcarbamoyl-AMP synthase [Candidatus Gottesmanbacteria bacterium RBG_16_52_11]|uniref:L-threonylcarbamoyladenylate synthase n=1 Tax=Candidatus Gottesmanbacteria bacterium RBG_16_52_11 TaxID=1798374 RepID=A0A1F5YMN2_9BACT|nr:MAG: threonylcarbamoyl-AMP synthase [Candidatus Gottesmanbacteria bacterium RBG_16_52_11]
MKSVTGLLKSKIVSPERAEILLNAGGILIYPTDTAFGIGCLIGASESVRRLFEIRQRPARQAMPALVASVEMALDYFDRPGPTVRRLMRTHWPGALTIVAPAVPGKIDLRISGGGTTIGLRMPDYPPVLSLIASCGTPLLGPSANIHGRPTPYSLSDVDPLLVMHSDGVMSGTVEHRLPSTVIDCTGSKVRIIRQGAVRI